MSLVRWEKSTKQQHRLEHVSSWKGAKLPSRASTSSLELNQLISWNFGEFFGLENRIHSLFVRISSEIRGISCNWKRKMIIRIRSHGMLSRFESVNWTEGEWCSQNWSSKRWWISKAFLILPKGVWLVDLKQPSYIANIEETIRIQFHSQSGPSVKALIECSPSSNFSSAQICWEKR